MGVIGKLRRLSVQDLSRLRAEPDASNMYFLQPAPEGFGPFEEFDMDKAWQGIHWLLNQDAWDGDPPLDFLTVGGEPIGDDSMGSGPARGFDAAAVKNLAEALSAITVEQLTANFDEEEMELAQVYPPIWMDLGPDALEYLLSNFEAVRDLVTQAAEEGQALIMRLD